MSWELVIVLAMITYASRAAAMVFLPPLPHRFRAALDRMPAALFAGLAAQSLIVPGVGLADTATVAGAAGALAVAPRRSLPLCLVAGVLSYLAFSALT